MVQTAPFTFPCLVIPGMFKAGKSLWGQQVQLPPPLCGHHCPVSPRATSTGFEHFRHWELLWTALPMKKFFLISNIIEPWDGLGSQIPPRATLAWQGHLPLSQGVPSVPPDLGHCQDPGAALGILFSSPSRGEISPLVQLEAIEVSSEHFLFCWPAV